MIVLASVLLAVIAVLLATHQVAANRCSREKNKALLAILGRLAEGTDVDCAPMVGRLEVLERQVKDLPEAWDTAKRKAENAESRARYHARRALTELEEHGFSTAGMETVRGELFESNGEGGGDEGVPALPESVESQPAPDDWLQITRRKKYGTPS